MNIRSPPPDIQSWRESPLTGVFAQGLAEGEMLGLAVGGQVPGVGHPRASLADHSARRLTSSHCTFWKKASTYFAAAAPKSMW